MKQLLLYVLLCTLLANFSLFGQADIVTILHVNDTHSNLAPIGPRNGSLQGSLGGIARAVTLVGMERMADPNALFLHAGDVSIGDLFYTKYLAAAELQLLAAVGCDAMAVGNHEFDLTPAYLDTSLANGFAGGGFPLLSANTILEDPAVEPLKQYIKPYMIKQVGNVKVGIFGLTTPATNLLSQPAPAVVDTNFIQTAAAMVETLMTNGCSVVICLSHLGYQYDTLVAQYVPGIHAIVGGHDHYAFEEARPVQNPVGDTTWIVQASSFYLAMGKLRLNVENGEVHLLDYTLIPIDDSIPEEPTTKGAVDGMIADIESVYGPLFTVQVAEVTSYFEEVADSLMIDGLRQGDTPIGNLVTDAFRATTQTQIAMEVGGSTAHPLYPGPIVAADVFRVIGYGFNTTNGLGYRLATFEMSGMALLMGLEFGCSQIEVDDEFLVQVSGMSYWFDNRKPAYSRVDPEKVVVGGVPLDPSATYTVTANEFVPMFLSAFGIPFENLYVCSADTTEFSALLGYIQQLGTLAPGVEGRITITDVPSVRPGEAIPQKYDLEQNYPNPFNPSTTIGFALPQKAQVKVEVYDILGNLVNTLVDQEMGAGSHSVVWDGIDRRGQAVATGVYLYRLQSGSFNTVKKMLFLK